MPPLGRRRALRLQQRGAELLQLTAAHRVADLGEQVVLFLLDVMADHLHQHGHLGDIPFGRGRHAVELGEAELDQVVLFQRLEDEVVLGECGAD